MEPSGGCTGGDGGVGEGDAAEVRLLLSQPKEQYWSFRLFLI